MSKHRYRGRRNSNTSPLIQLTSKLSKILKKRISIAVLTTVMVIAGHGMSSIVSAQVVSESLPQMASLKSVAVPEPSNLAEFISDKTAAIALGKSLFWDMQVGSNGKQACASCHFHAGADSRSKHQLSPGLLRVNADGSSNADTVFDLAKLNYQLKPSDYPFHKLADPNDRNSTVIADSNDVTGSQGTFDFSFSRVLSRRSKEVGVIQQNPVFKMGNTNLLQVTGRNSPSVINAVFNFRNFWDGRAQNEFNGVNPFGSRDPNAKVVKATNSGSLQEVQISLDNASLASQAVGPAVSEVEMSFKGRPFSQIGKKLLSLTALGMQKVHPEDSILGAFSNWPKQGIQAKYQALVQAAFRPEWWNSKRVITIDANGKPAFSSEGGTSDPKSTTQFSLIEYNFPLFFGLAIQMYESTLIANDTPFDRLMEGNPTALTDTQKKGLEIFQTKGKCINCHSGAEFTKASVKNVQNERIERMIMGNGQEAIYDNGFYNIAVSPTQEDLGLGGKDSFGNPLSESRLAQQGRFLDPKLNPPISSDETVVADGAFKTPGLRNIELTAPYFHNGGQLTLSQVVDFYNRGGDFHDQNIDNLDPDIENLGLTDVEKQALVDFLKSLTDERVRYQKAPFDHPQLFITDGHPGKAESVSDDGTGKATLKFREIPAVGRNGGSPLPNFLAGS